MDNYLKLLAIIGPLVLLILLAFVAKKLKILNKDNAIFLNNVIVYVTLPALVFNAIYKAKLSFSFFEIPLIAILAMAIIMLVVFLIFRKTALEPTVFGGLLLVSSIGNTGYLGYPLALRLAGNPGLVRAIFYDLFGTVVFILTVGLFIAEYYGAVKLKTNKILEIITFPAIVALVAGLIFKNFTLPPYVLLFLNQLGKLTIILIMISVGLSLEFIEAKGYTKLFILVVFTKLIISPLLGFGIAKLFMLAEKSLAITVLEASMPSAMLSLVFGIKYKLNTAFISSAIFATTILSIVTISLFQVLLVNG